jgi:hypothetical protein
MNVVVLQLIIATGLLGASLWWYRRNIGDESGNAGWVLWVLWVVFGILSLIVLVASGPEAVLFGGVLTWFMCVAGTGLGSRLLARSFRSHEQEVWKLSVLFAGGSALVVFVIVWTQLQSALLNTS